MKGSDLIGNIFVVPLIVLGMATIAGFSASSVTRLLLSLVYAIFVMVGFDLFARRERKVLVARALGFVISCGGILFALSLFFSRWRA